MFIYKEAALSSLKYISDLWQVNAARTQWITPDAYNLMGFDWWPGDFCVRVRTIPPQDGICGDGFKISIQTDFLKNVDIQSERFEEMTATLSRFFTCTYSWVYPPKQLWNRYATSDSSPTLYLSASAYIDAENIGWMTEFIANTSIIQPINAQIQSASVTELIGCGQPDKSRPNQSDSSKLDEILEVVAQVYAPLGQEPSRFANTGEFEDFASKYAKCDMCFGFGDPAGMTLETPFGNDSALIRFHTSEKHPQLGFGLLITLQLPWFNDKLVTAREVAEMNMLESILWCGFPQLGSWHNSEGRGGQDGVAFTLFLPNALYKHGLVAHVAFWFLERARWAREQKFPDMKDNTMAEILKNRLG